MSKRLEFLKKKPIPSTFEKVAAKPGTQQDKVFLKTQITNKTDTSSFDKAALLHDIKGKIGIGYSVERIEDSKPLPKPPVKKSPLPIGKPRKLKARLRLMYDPYVIKSQLSDESIQSSSKRKRKKEDKPEIEEEKQKEPIKSKPIKGKLIPDVDLPKGEKETYDKVDQLSLPISPYYLNNREFFINSINRLFDGFDDDSEDEYEDETKDVMKEKCLKAQDSDEFTLMTHQKIVKMYIQLYTPYRGLLLYHGLGSGKTCSSIAIVEGLKSHKKVYIMTPASLEKNYKTQLKECGDKLYRLNQHWSKKKINIKNIDELNEMVSLLGIKKTTIRSMGGGWIADTTSPPNYNSLSSDEKKEIDTQINELLDAKYTFLHYNGLRDRHISKHSNNYSRNMFDNSVVVVDEAHNLISQIVNKIGSINLEKLHTLVESGDQVLSISLKLYHYLMDAKNCKIILLSGTPMINYPNELAIIFNILRGYIKTWSFKVSTSGALSEMDIKKTLGAIGTVDYVEYNSNNELLTITKNPFGFYNMEDASNKFLGVKYDERGNMSDDDFEQAIQAALLNKKVKIIEKKIALNRALPEKFEMFSQMFLNDKGEIQNKKTLQKRILGLVSYLGDKKALMPEILNTNMIEIEMSDFQIPIYAEARYSELNEAKRNAKKKKKESIYDNTTSTYRVFSRAFCNFVFPGDTLPNGKKLVRPMPHSNDDAKEGGIKVAETDIDALNSEQLEAFPDGIYDGSNLSAELDRESNTYGKKIYDALSGLKSNSNKYLSRAGLSKYSPKFLKILDVIEETSNNPEQDGLHLIYSQFRTLEGIGVFKLVLEENGFAELKVKKDALGIYELDIKEEDFGKPRFALYTGTETEEERELIRNIYNSAWEKIPVKMKEELEKMSSNNFYGEILKILMITSSGAEGINLKNVRHVHIMEPYWHPVRLEQVIGRARRICSHIDLPLNKRNIQIYIYIMVFSEEQKKKKEAYKELFIKDKSDSGNPETSDGHLLSILTKKRLITDQMLLILKETSIDCLVNTKNESNVQCLSLTSGYNTKYAYKPKLLTTDSDKQDVLNVKKKEIKPVVKKYGDTYYAVELTHKEIYDLKKYKKGVIEKVGELVDGKPIFS